MKKLFLLLAYVLLLTGAASAAERVIVDWECDDGGAPFVMRGHIDFHKRGAKVGTARFYCNQSTNQRSSVTLSDVPILANQQAVITTNQGETVCKNQVQKYMGWPISFGSLVCQANEGHLIMFWRRVQ